MQPGYYSCRVSSPLRDRGQFSVTTRSSLHSTILILINMCDLLRLLTLSKGIVRGFKFSIGVLRHHCHHGNSLNPPTSWPSPSLLNGETPHRLSNCKIHALSEQWFTQDRVGTDGRLRPSGMRPTAPSPLLTHRPQ